MREILQRLVGTQVKVRMDRGAVGTDVKFRPVFYARPTGTTGRFAHFVTEDGEEISIAIGTIREIAPASAAN